jgi:hypothetical protein
VSTYREIIGKKIKKVSSDPSSGIDGEMWYNSTTKSIRGLAISQAWVSSSPMTTGRADGTGSAGTSTAGFYGGASSPDSTITEEYNGTGWSANPAMNDNLTQRIGFGTYTAAVVAGGWGPPNSAETEEFNGTAFTNEESLPTATRDMAGFGTQTAGVACVGATGSLVTATYEYNGEAWTGGNAFPTATRNTTGNGATQTAGILVGGETPSASNQAVIYDGTNWTAVTNYPISRAGVMSNGPQTDTIVAGGTPPTTTTTSAKWDGTSWTAMPNLASGRYDGGRFGGGGSPDSAVVAGGVSAPTATEEFTVSTNAITAGAFASGTNLPVTRGQGGGCGTQTAALQCGGIAASPTSNTTTSFEYDGSAWAASPGSLNAATRNNSNFGIQTAAVTVGSLGPVTAAVDTYNGSSWTSGTSYPAPVSNIGVAGTNTAGLAWGGDQDPGYLNTTNEYNGSWTSSNTIPAARSNSACAGTQTAGLSVGGLVGPAAPSAPEVASSIEYDGSSWTAGGTDLVARYNAGAAGIQTSALIFGGTTPPGGLISTATLYDGTSFVTQPSMGTARFLQTQGLGDTSTVALAAAGQTTTRVDTVEEFTGETTTANIKDFTATQS